MNAAQLLQQTSVSVLPETFTLVSIDAESWRRLMSRPELSPRMTAPFLIFMDDHEVTLLLDEADFGNIRIGLNDAKVEQGFRLLTFDVVMDFTVVGFLAEVARILADARISIVALSAFSRDHLLIKQTDLAAALKALGSHVLELC